MVFLKSFIFLKKCSLFMSLPQELKAVKKIPLWDQRLIISSSEELKNGQKKRFQMSHQTYIFGIQNAPLLLLLLIKLMVLLLSLKSEPSLPFFH